MLKTCSEEPVEPASSKAAGIKPLAIADTPEMEIKIWTKIADTPEMFVKSWTKIGYCTLHRKVSDIKHLN